MRITKFDHACLLVEDGGARVLLDPGTFSTGFEGLTGLTGVLITHQHPDHLDRDRIGALLEGSPDARVHADEGSVSVLADLGIAAEVARGGDAFDLAGLAVRVVGGEHAVIHPDLPVIPNVGYLLGGRFLHPGDAFTVPAEPVQVLGLPASAPWQKASEAVDYLRAVRPRVAVPIHDGLLARPAVYYGLFRQLAPEGTELTVIDGRTPLEV